MKALAPHLAGLALLLSVCATSAGAQTPPASTVKIIEPEEIFSAADWTPDVEAALRAAGWGDRLEQVKTHINESGGGWPKFLADEETRHFQADALKMYKAEQIASLRFYDQDAVLLRIPAASNKHMLDGWRPTEDFFVIMSAKAVAKAD